MVKLILVLGAFISAYFYKTEAFKGLFKLKKTKEEDEPAPLEEGFSQQEKNAHQLVQKGEEAYTKGENPAASFYEALKIFNALAEEAPADFLPEVASLGALTGKLFMNASQAYKADDSYTMAVKAYRLLTQEEPQTYNLQLAQTLEDQTLAKYAIIENAKTLKHDKDFMRYAREKTTDTQAPASSDEIVELVISAENQEILDLREEAVAIYMELAEKEPETHGPTLANRWYFLGSDYYDHGELQKAKEVFNKAMHYYRQMAKHTLQYNDYLMAVYSELGLIFKKEKAFREAENLFFKALEVNLLNIPAAERQRLQATAFANLGLLYFARKSYQDAIAYHLKAVKLRKALVQQNKDTYHVDLANSYLALMQTYVTLTSTQDLNHLGRVLEYYDKISALLEDYCDEADAKKILEKANRLKTKLQNL